MRGEGSSLGRRWIIGNLKQLCEQLHHALDIFEELHPDKEGSGSSIIPLLMVVSGQTPSKPTK
jgi:hypothetical protein